MPTDLLRPGSTLSAQFTPTDPLADSSLNLADGDDLTYNESSTDGHKDSFACRHLPVDRWKVTAAPSIVWRARNTLLGSARVWWKLGGTTVNGTTQALSGTITNYTQASIARPGGGTWTPADFLTLEWGYEIVAGLAGATRIYDLKLDPVATSVYSATPASIRTIDEVTEPAREPVRCTVDFTLQDPEDIDYVDGTADQVLVVGAFTVPGSVNPVYLTLSRNAVVNPRT